MNIRVLKSDLLLLLTAAIWGFAFVAQRAGMEHVGPFIFNALRFSIGSLFLLPFVLVRLRKTAQNQGVPLRDEGNILVLGGLLTGLVIFIGSSFQQVGMVYTTAGKAGFVTGLYVLFVPILGLFLKQRTGMVTWFGVILATVGMYLLSMAEISTASRGDVLVLVSAFVWAGHVLIIAWLSPRVDAIKLAFIQFVICAILSFIVSFLFEKTTMQAIYQAAIPILYGGFFSVGMAFTLQIIAQRDTPPSHAAIIMSSEAIFAALGGWLILSETFSLKEFLGCALMLAGMLLSKTSRVPKGE